jgi:hypothetical protein
MPNSGRSNLQTEADLHARIETYVAHLASITRVFNNHARRLGLGVRLNADRENDSVRSGGGLSRVMRFLERTDDSGVLHDPQLMTALDCIGEFLTSPHRSGLVLGAMQSGKTTTSLALQFAGPTIYLLTGRRMYPIYLITSHTSQEDQTQIELQRFLDFYGELRVYVDEQHQCRLIDYVRTLRGDPAFCLSPTINMYREHVLRRALRDTFVGPRLEDFIQRRAAGESIRRVADLCRRANQQGFEPLLIIDEPQYGASDRFVEVEGQIERRACVQLQIFQRIEEALGPDAPEHRFVGFSATPYELNGLEAVWKVKQYLSSSYRGFNYFGGEVIDADATVSPPRTLSFQEYGKANELPFLQDVSLAAYDAHPRLFGRFARKIGFAGTQAEYRLRVENTLRAVILQMAASGTQPDVGICVRLFNANRKSHQLIENLRLGEHQIEIIEYFGSEHRGNSVKRAIQQRTRHGLPFLIAVTNRARMGDAFPRSVEWFLEFSNKASDLNALLQGLLGRACGYGKRSTVIMSAENVRLVRDYERSQGGYIYKTSRHSLVVGNYRRGAPTSLIRLRADANDPLLEQYFSRLQTEVVDGAVIQNEGSLSTRRATGHRNYRTGPILRIAEELGLFDYLERPDVRERLFPTYPDFRIARARDRVQHARQPGRTLGYTLDENGECRFTFRWTEDGEHGGARSRGYGGRDASNRERAGDTLEPQVNMRKFDARTGEPIDDKKTRAKPDRVPGNWQAVMVTLPLVSPVRELRAGETTFPIEVSPYSALMNQEERAAAGFPPT